jgi:thiol-disulfide isomerase/thioredoxin
LEQWSWESGKEPSGTVSKTVVLDFFSVGCPSCQENTPHLDSLWQQYGYNGDSVWFWGIESYYADSQQIEDFRQQYGGTFPFFSTKDDTTVLGLYNITYTPQYYITCPDHSAKKIYIDQIETYILSCKENIVTTQAIKKQPHFLYGTHKGGISVTNYGNRALQVIIFNILGSQIEKKQILPSTTINITLPSGSIYIAKFISNKSGFDKSYKIVIP